MGSVVKKRVTGKKGSKKKLFKRKFKSARLRQKEDIRKNPWKKNVLEKKRKCELLLESIATKKPTHLMLEMPVKKDPNISQAGYRQYIKNNRFRLENDLNAEDKIVVKDEDIIKETEQKLIEYERILTEEVQRYVWANHLKKALRVKAQVATTLFDEFGNVLPGAFPSETIDEEEDDEEENEDEEEPVKSEQELAKEREEEEKRIAEGWETFVENGIKDRMHAEVYDRKYDEWYEATFLNVKTQAGFTHFKVHYFKFKKRFDYNTKIKTSDWTVKNLQKEHKYAPPRTFTDGGRFPVPKTVVPKIEVVEPSEDEGDEDEATTQMSGDQQPKLFGTGDLDKGNIVHGSRKRRRVKDFDVEDTITEIPAEHACGVCCEKFFARDLNSEEMLLQCEGGCFKHYHLACLELDRVPDGKFVCPMCENGSHECFSCQCSHVEHGDEGKTCYMEKAVRCSFKDCSLHFHPECIRKEEPRASILSAENATGEFEFICPGHCCSVCFERTADVQASSANVVIPCLSCRNAFHERCLPYGSTKNNLGFHCNECARKYTLPLSSVSEEVFIENRKIRQTGECPLDFTRFFQKLASELNVDKFVDMRVGAPVFLSQNNALKNQPALRRKKDPPPKYQKIYRNSYSHECKPILLTDAFDGMCQCKEECGENCDNRLLKIECHQARSAGDVKNAKIRPNCNSKKCKNRQFQNSNHKKSETH
uniref:Uncharacterized protein n=1 Tax=Mucochytrium quahogii TaxID=96639 RepID=A0A7S2WEP8_9STRA|mmetsp:Transcript_21713/g.47319  ORF Transcript_21713/g.47319 Transcript_21713/m.47319 type:complete len:707 (+) Transcript_21713:175-2295(+)